MRARPDIDTAEAWREYRAHRIAQLAEAVALAIGGAVAGTVVMLGVLFLVAGRLP